MSKIRDSYDLLLYISKNNGVLHLLSNTHLELGISTDVLENHLLDLETKGYIKRYIRSCGITSDGKDFLNS